MPHDVITIGSATVDLFMKSPDFHLQKIDKGVLLCQDYGGKVDIDQFELRSGGAGTNTAVGFARLGFQTAAVVEIGKDLFGQIVWDDLRRENVDTSFIVSEHDERTAVSVLLISEDGGRSALTYRGASSMLEARDIPWAEVNVARWLHLSNVSGNIELLSHIFDVIRQKKVGLSWTPGKKELQLLADRKLQVSAVACDILTLNRAEWQLVSAIQSSLLEIIPTVVVTNGRDGGDVFVKGKQMHHYQIQPTKAVQETGAGDAFTVGFVAGHLWGASIDESCKFGAKNAASVVNGVDAKQGLLTKEKLHV